MSRKVDKRVVAMEYDGSGFDPTVVRSEKAFSAFKDSVARDGNSIVAALASIDQKLSVRGVAIAATITKMTNAVTAQLTKLANEFVKQPISDGFEEYEIKLKAIYNMFNAVKNKGSSMSDVEKSVADLNAYSDRTIYNLGNMVDNMSKFTTAGGALHESQGIVIGMSNLAASAGVTNERLAGATYQMSQLSDTLMLLDYNSIAAANLATENFKNTMIDVAKESGRTMSKFGGKEGSNKAAEYFEKATKAGIDFRSMISDKVFKKTDFVETMRRFSIDTTIALKTLDDMNREFKTMSATTPISGETYERIKKLGEDRAFADEMMRVSKAGGQMIKTLGGVATEAMDVETYLKKAAEKGYTFEQMAKDTNFTVGDLQKTLDRLSIAKGMYLAATEVRTFTQMMTTVKESIASGFGDMFLSIFGNLEQATALWTGMTNAINGIVGPIQNAMNVSLAFWNAQGGREAVIGGIVNIFNALADVVRPIIKAMKAVFAPLTGADLVDASKKFENFTATLRPSKALIEGIATAAYVLFSVLKLGIDLLKVAGRVIWAVVSPLKGFAPVLKELGDMFTNLLVNLGLFASEGDAAITFTDALVNGLTRLSDLLVKIVGGGLRIFGNGLSKLTNWLKPPVKQAVIATDELQKIVDTAESTGKSINEVVASYVLSKGLNGEEAATMIDKITGAVGALKKTAAGGSSFGAWLSDWTNLLPKSFDELMRLFDNVIKLKLVNLGAAVGEGISESLEALMTPIKATRPQKMIFALGALAVSLYVLSVSIVRLANVPFDALITGMATLGIGLRMVSSFIKTFAKATKTLDPKQLISMRGIMKGISILLLSLAVSLKLLSRASPEGVVLGVLAMILVVKAITKQMAVISAMPGVEKSALVMGQISKAILIISIGLRILANANIVKMAAAAIVLSRTVKVMVKMLHSTKGVNAGQLVVLGVISAAVVILSAALRVLATAKAKNALAAMFSLDKVLKTMVKILKALGKIGNVQTAVATFAMMSASLSVLVGALALLAVNETGPILAATMGLSKVITILAKTFSKMPEGSAAKSANFLTLMKGVSLLSTALSTLAKAKFSSIIASAIALKIVMKSMMKIFKDVPGNIDVNGIRNMGIGLSLIAVGLAVLATQRLGNIIVAAIMLNKVIKAVAKAMVHMDATRVEPRMILAFTGGIALVALGLAVLSSIPHGRQLSAGIGLALVVKAVGKAFKNLNNSRVNVREILAFTGGVSILAMALTVLALNPIGRQISAGIGLGLVTIAVGAALKYASNSRVNPADILAFTVGLSLLALSMSLLSKNSPEAIIAAGAAMSVAMIGLAVAMQIMSPVANDAAKIAAAMLMVGVGMAALGVAMVLMTAAGPVGVALALGTLIVVLAALAVVALALTAAVAPLLAIGAAVALVGAGIGMMGVGALTGVMALEKLINLIASAPETFKQAASNIGVVAESFKTIAIGIGEAIAVVLSAIIIIVVTAITQLLLELAKHAGALASAGVQLMIAFLRGLLEHIAELVTVGIEIVAQLLHGIAQGLPPLLEAAVQVLLSFISGMVETLDKHMGDVMNIGWNLIITIVKGLALAFQKSLANIKKIGGAIWKALVKAVTPGGGGLENALGGLVGDLDKMLVKVDATAGGLKSLSGASIDATSSAEKLKGALKGAGGAFSDFTGKMKGLGGDKKKGGGIAGLLGLSDSQEDAFDKKSFLPDGTFSGEATGEAKAAEVGQGFADGVDGKGPTKKAAAKKTTKEATEKLVKEGIADPLTAEGKKAAMVASKIGGDIGDALVESLAASISKSGASGPSALVQSMVREVRETALEDAKREAAKAEALAAAKALDDEDKALIAAYDALQNEKWNEARNKALKEAEKTGKAIPEKYMTQDEKWAAAAKKMTKAQYDALVESQKMSREMREQQLQAETDAALALEASIKDTSLGSLMMMMHELELEATPAGIALDKFSVAIEKTAEALEDAELSATLKTVSNGFTLVGKLVPEMSDITSALGDFAATLSTIGTDGVSSLTAMYSALSALGTAILDIAINKARELLERVKDAISGVVDATLAGISDLITTSTQIGVDVVVDITGWVLKGGDEQLPSMGDLMGTIIDSVGGAAVGAGVSIAESMITGMMNVFGLGAFNGIVTAFTGMFGSLGKMATTAMGKIVPMLYTALKNLSVKLMPAWLTTFTGSFQKIFKRFFNRLFGEGSGDDGAKWFREHGSQLGEVYVEGMQNSTSAGDDVVSQTGSWLTEIANKLKSSRSLFGVLAGELVQAFADAWNGFDRWFKEIGEGLVGLISAGASGNIAVIYDYIQDLLYHLTNGFLGKEADVSNLGDNLPAWLMGNHEAIVAGVRRFITTLFNMMTLGVFTRGPDAILLGKMMNDRIVDGLADTPGEALSQIISGIISALMKFAGAMIPDLIVLGGEVTNAIIMGMLDFVSQGGLFEIISAIFKGLWNGFIVSEVNIFNIGWLIAKAMWEGFLAMLGIRSPSKLFESAIEFVVLGLLNGIGNFASALWDAGVALATRLWKGFCNFLGINSPSKMFLLGGEHCVAGLTKGLSDVAPVDKAMEALADAMEEGLNILEDVVPTISPVVDLDDVRKQASAVQQMFGGISTTSRLAASVTNRQNGTGSSGSVAPQSPGSVTFTQNIHAPTELSPRQIYRYTGSLLEVKRRELA